MAAKREAEEQVAAEAAVAAAEEEAAAANAIAARDRAIAAAAGTLDPELLSLNPCPYTLNPKS